MTADLTYIVPLLHPSACRNWTNVLARLQESLASLENSFRSDTGVNIALVINRGSPLDGVRLPQGTQVIEVDLAPPPVSVFKGEIEERDRIKAVTYDKGYKVATGSKWAKDNGSRYVMSVDADDLVSRNITSLPCHSSDRHGWFVKNGWVLDHQSLLAMRVPDFHNWCGTFSIVKTDLLPTQQPVDTLPTDIISDIFGHHRFMMPALQAQGTPLKPVDFPAAAYVINHSEGNYGRKSLLRTKFNLSRLASNPSKYLNRLVSLRYFGGKMRREFGFKRHLTT